MSLKHDVVALVQGPRDLLRERLTSPPSWPAFVVMIILPLIIIRPIADFLASVMTGHPIAAMVLGTSGFVLQVGCLIGLALILPTVVRQFHGALTETQSFLLAAYASIPLWLAGCLYLAPDEFLWLFIISRLAVVAAASYGIYLLHVGLEELQVPSRHLVVGATVGGYVTLYLLLWGLLGVTSHIMLIFLRS
ncbi:MAG: YIP1 family protein [Myxococcota bacterium]